ncbi:SDR family oxidoreductase [Micromonospora sp. WMMA1363]|uniref:SDR family NAD(P)-dependent oxidoreductase n=1 Tax=Micromonospora sp. WMMA1363 TaxID=3053985 RepID=UPI00259D03CA|nr:SDR family oxidoreductase [Micromonospora sp. WMMA1363]MDM4719723.1 SDR family oxidoreductase [Micromonospora sp. WMMA1363]
MDLGLTDRVYVVSGGTRGLGFAVARSLTAEGARVVVSGRDAGRLAAAVEALGAPQAAGVLADNADPTSPARLVAAALDRWERLDGALINGGGPPLGSVLEISDDTWRHSFESVFLGAVRVARAIAENLAEDGSIAFVLSTSVHVPIPGLDISNGLRPGLAMVTRTMATRLGSRGIRVNALLPGRITTERTSYVDGGPAGSTTAAIPLGRSGDPSEFGRVAAFVLSPAASYLSGALIPVDGGASA